jgi:hypothetical protein
MMKTSIPFPETIRHDEFLLSSMVFFRRRSRPRNIVVYAFAELGGEQHVGSDGPMLTPSPAQTGRRDLILGDSMVLDPPVIFRAVFIPVDPFFRRARPPPAATTSTR